MKQQADRWSRILDVAIIVIGCAMAAYQMLSTQVLFQSLIEHSNTHLGFALTLVFLSTLKGMKRRKFLPVLFVLILLAASLAVVTYVKVNFKELDYRRGMPNATDVIIGLILLVVVFEACRETWGKIIPIIGLVLIAYFFWGGNLPWGLAHGGYYFDFMISSLGIGFTGVYGLMDVSANYIFLFLIYGGILQVTGVFQLFLELGKWAGKFLVGGAGQTDVICSAMVGTVQGTAVGTIVTEGPFTIPMMKKAGFSAEMAGAIEATNATGAQLSPPVLGAAAFIMASFLGVPYVVILLASIIPTVLYYYSVSIGVEVIARKQKIKPLAETVDYKLMLRRTPAFVIPFALMTVLLVMRVSPMYAAFYSIIALLALSFMLKDTRPSLPVLLRGIADGAVGGAKIAVIIGVLGVVAEVFFVTNLGVKFTGIVIAIAQGNIIITLLLAMVVSIILGCGVTTTGVYVLVAIVVAPAVVALGVPPLAAHFFSFYFALMSAVTPPVATAALTATALAGSKYWPTGLYATRLAIAGFFMPFCWIFNPVILWQPGQSVLGGTYTLIASLIGMTTLVAVVYNHFMYPITWWEFALYLISTVLFFFYIFTTDIHTLFYIAMGIFLFLMLLQWRTKRRKARMQMAPSPT